MVFKYFYKKINSINSKSYAYIDNILPYKQTNVKRQILLDTYILYLYSKVILILSLNHEPSSYHSIRNNFLYCSWLKCKYIK